MSTRRLHWPIERLAKDQVFGEVVAGLTLCAVGLPAVMGYALIAHMPIVTGLYTFVLPMLAFAIFGSSRHLIVAGDSASAALLAAGLLGVVAVGTPQYLAAAVVVSLLVGVILLLVRLFRLTFVSNFLSRTILVGFLTGVGIQVALNQLPNLLGVRAKSADSVLLLVRCCEQLGHVTVLDVVLGATSLALLIGARVLSRRIPGGFIIMTLGIFVGYLLRHGHHLSYVGRVPGGLPRLSVGHVPWSSFSRLSEIALSIVIVVVAQSAATSRAFADRYGESVNENRDIVGLSIANILAGLSGTFPVNSSPTRASMAEEAGGRTRWMGVVAVGATVVVLLFLTGPLQYLPTPVLAAAVFGIGLRLIDLRGLARIGALRRDEFIVALVTALAVVVLGVENGILLSALLAIVNHLRRGYAPTNFLVVLEDGVWASRSVASKESAKPGLYVYRFQASLWYANVNRFVDETMSLVDRDTREICFDFTSIASVDYSAGTSLVRLVTELELAGIILRFTHVDTTVLVQLEQYGVVTANSASIVRSTRDVLDDFEPTVA